MEIRHINSYFISSHLHAELVEMLDQYGIRQQVFVPVQNTTFIGENLPTGIRKAEVIFDHCFNSFDRYLWPLKILKIWNSYKKRFSNSQPDLIHAHSLIVNGLIAYLAHKKWGTSFMVSVRFTDVHIFMERSFIFRWIGYKILKNAKAVMLLSPTYRDIQLKKLFNAKAFEAILKKSHTIPNGINDYWLVNNHKIRQLNAVPTVIFVGTIEKRKNLPNLISACEVLFEEGFQIKLDVIGDGPLLKDSKSKFYKIKVRFHGRIVNRTQLLQLYRQADVLVVPSLMETFGLVYPEAMSQGLPIVYTKNQGFDGFFPDGFVGYAINPHSPYDIAEKIKMIFNDYQRISANAAKASAQFNWKTIAEDIITVYDSSI